VAVRVTSRTLQPIGSLRWLDRAVHHLFSFEFCFALFLYSNRFQPMLPPLPVDPTMLTAALCVPLAVILVLRQGIYLRGMPILAAHLAFVAFAVISLAWTTPGHRLANVYLAQLGGLSTLCVIAGALVIAPSRERAMRFLAFILLMSVFISLYGMWIYVTYGTFRFYRGFGDSAARLYLSWGYAVTSGAVIAYVIALAAPIGSRRQIVGILLFAVSFIFLLVASGRGPLLAVAVACLPPLLLDSVEVSRGRVLVRYTALLAALMILAGALVIVYLVLSGQATGTLNRFGKLFAEAQDPELIQGANRFAYFAAAIDFWIRSPIFGNGVGSFSTMFIGMEVPGTHAHNIILDILTSYGLVGLALFGLTLFFALRFATLRRLREDPILMCVLLLFISRFIGGMFNTEISAQQPMMAFLALMALRPPAERTDEAAIVASGRDA